MPVRQPSSGCLETAGRLKLDVISDVICPWCFIGKRRLEKALASVAPRVQAELRWLPFELNPVMPKGGIDRLRYRTAKFGSWERSQILDRQVAAVGAQEGIVFRHDRISRTPNTFDAHRLIWLAGEAGVQDAVVEGLFNAYFVEGRDIGDIEVLADVAVAGGFDRDKVSEQLAAGAGTEEVCGELGYARSLGIDSVPTFLANGRPLFSGAIESDLMAQRIRAATGSS